MSVADTITTLKLNHAAVELPESPGVSAPAAAPLPHVTFAQPESITQVRVAEQKPVHDQRYNDIALDIARLVTSKQLAYGDSFGRAGHILEILYPHGVQPDQYRDLLAITRVLDKLFRVATCKSAFEESPWRDILGYALLSVAADDAAVNPSGIAHCNAMGE